MIVKRLTRAIPEGYQPQKQRGSESAVVLISEWARKAAHELNDKHHNWIEARVKDEFADQNLSESQVREAIDHSALLMSFKQVREYLPKVERDYRMIQAYVTYLKDTKDYVGRQKVGRQQWAAHKLAQSEEAAYKFCLYRILNERIKQFNRAANNRRHVISQKINDDFDAASTLYALVMKLLNRAGRGIITDEEQIAFDCVKDYMHAKQIVLVENGIVPPDETGALIGGGDAHSAKATA